MKTAPDKFRHMRIRELSHAEFIELRNYFLEGDDGSGGFPSLADALETTRGVLGEALHNTPLNAIAPDMRHKLAVLLDVATWALVMHQAADMV